MDGLSMRESDSDNNLYLLHLKNPSSFALLRCRAFTFFLCQSSFLTLDQIWIELNSLTIVSNVPSCLPSWLGRWNFLLIHLTFTPSYSICHFIGKLTVGVQTLIVLEKSNNSILLSSNLIYLKGHWNANFHLSDVKAQRRTL